MKYSRRNRTNFQENQTSTHRKFIRRHLRGFESLESRNLMAVSIGDYVWRDFNSDGLQNEDVSAGVNNVEVRLFRSDDTLVRTTFTKYAIDDPFTPENPGYYHFADIETGEYYIVFALPPTCVQFTTRFSTGNEDASNDSNADASGRSNNFTLVDGEDNFSIDAGLIAAPACIGNQVFWDQNEDGIQADIEPGIAGATVKLLWAGSPIKETQTDLFGQYAFNNLAAGNDYQVQFLYPEGFDVASPADQGSLENADSDGLGPDLVTAPISILADQFEREVDQGFYKTVNTSTVGNYVWRDDNSDGLQNEGPSFGVNGIAVELYTSGGSFVSATTTADDASGNPGFYQFTDVAEGFYYIEIIAPGEVFTEQFASNDPNIIGDSVVDSDGRTFTFFAGFENDLTLDAGLLPRIDLSLTGSVTNDTPEVDSTITYVITVSNAAGFSAASGVTVTDVIPEGVEYAFDTSVGDFNSTTRTWTVGDVAPGTSKTLNVVVTVGSGGVKTNVPQVQTASPLDVDSTPGNAPAIQEDDDLSITIVPSATIGDYVWRDANNNGVQDEPSSFGLNGVGVTLFTVDGVQVGSPTVTADKDGLPGYYAFGDINPGQYYVRFAVPAGQVFTTIGAGTPETDSNANIAGRSNFFTLSSGVDQLGIDAGLRPIDLSLTSVVSDPTPPVHSEVTITVTISNESGFSEATGVSVVDVIPDGMSYVSHIADNSAIYDPLSDTWEFFNIPSGASSTLVVVARVDSGETKSALTQVSSADQPDVDSAPSNAPAILEDDDVTLTLTPSATIGDYVWRDDNNDGIQNEPASSGVNGVTVTLFNSSGIQVGTSVTTADDINGNPGYYAFSDIDPGDYYVVFAPGSGQSFTTPFVGATSRDSNADANGRSDTFTLVSGLNDLSIDAGLRTQSCVTLHLEGNTATSGHAGNRFTFSSGNISAKASGFSRDRATGAWSTAYLGSYGGGLGVTDSSEGNGSNDTHVVDNLGGRDNYVVFAFNQLVVLDSIQLGYVVGDSDLTIWIGTVPNAYNSHQTLSDSLLDGLYTEENWTELTLARWADVNSTEIVGNFIVIAASTSDTSPEDRFKIARLELCTPGLQVPASLGDSVWHDQNGNGIREASEPGISGASVTLIGGGEDGVINGINDTTVSTITSVGGNYSFAGLVPGVQYQVSFALPSGYFAGSPRMVGGDRSIDSDGPVSRIIILGSGQSDMSIDAGFYREVKVGDFVWNDTNEDGIQGSTELGIGGVSLRLSGTSGDGSAISRSTTTASNGSYEFAALPPGSYQVSVAASNFELGGALSGFTASPTLVGVNRSSDSNTSPSTTSPVVLVSGATDQSVDFGYYLSLTKVCTGLFLEGHTPTSGTAGNILTFNSGVVAAKASAFSRDAAGRWAPAYLGRFAGGLGVTDTSEGSGAGNAHTVDNVGRVNYVLFEFSQTVTVDSAFLGYVSGDSDIRIWIGNAHNAFNSHYTLSDAFLTGLGFSEVNTGGNSTRTADFNAGNISGNILVIAANPGETHPNDQFKIAELSLCVHVPTASSGTKFFVADDGNNGTFKYGSLGEFQQDFAIAPANPRGITSNASGSNVWIADYHGRIFNYTSAGAHVANWHSRISGLQGVTTDGTNIWTVSESTDRVYFYPTGTNNTHGSNVSPKSSFGLHFYNKNPTGITTDGTFIWVVNEGNMAGGVGDMVFKYTKSGKYLGRWQLDSANARPTGITIDPSGGNRIWIVDNGTNRIYEYSGATGVVSGGLHASKSYALAPGNKNAQGIADPPASASTAIAVESSLAINEQFINPKVNPRNNSFNATDVNNDGTTSPVDALTVINRLTALRRGEALPKSAWVFDDVSNDNELSPIDALLVINFLSSDRSATPSFAPEVMPTEPATAALSDMADQSFADFADGKEPDFGLGFGEGEQEVDNFFASYGWPTEDNSRLTVGDQLTGSSLSERERMRRRMALSL